MDPLRRQAQRSQSDEPAKGGTRPAEKKMHPSGDDPKRQGDELQHAVDEAAERKKKQH